VAQREVASLLAQQKDEKAAIKVEAIIRYVHMPVLPFFLSVCALCASTHCPSLLLPPTHLNPPSPSSTYTRHLHAQTPHLHQHSEDATIEAYGILELVCDLLHERARLIASEKECPEDLKSAVVTLIWATNRADVAELHEVKKQFAKKFGKEFVERAEKDEDRLVNERVAHKLSIRPVCARRGVGREGPLLCFMFFACLIFFPATLASSCFSVLLTLALTLPPLPPEKYLREIALKTTLTGRHSSNPPT